ncbi:Phosphatidylinositol transfer protein SEC14 [Quillaja saponaria]|uniref:Phosphatidylinositol transfer protein SEC14 n=1 Tax=Quillaja saponaria TaxID=32244 RepID=A0AAD7LMD5_QUISA|nr:Phosphatidylinositol transfer protein SEC14 [Quillaja saponaria]
MSITNQEAVRQFQSLMEEMDESMKKTIQVSLLFANFANISKPFQLVDCLQWRIQNEIDTVVTPSIFQLEELQPVLKQKIHTADFGRYPKNGWTKERREHD